MGIRAGVEVVFVDVKNFLAERGAQMPPPKMPDALWEDVSGRCSILSYRAGEIIYGQNMPTAGTYIIKSGRVKMSYITDDGVETILVVFSRHCMFGELSAIRGVLASPIATALTDVTAVLIPTDRLFELIDASPQFSRFMIESLVHKLHTSSAQLFAIAGNKVLSRVATTILLLDSYGIPCDSASKFYTITHAEMASLTNTRRPNATVCLNQLAQQGLIELRRNGIKILSRSRLEKLSSDMG